MLSSYSIRKFVNLLSWGGGSAAAENSPSFAVNHAGHAFGTEEFAFVSESRPCLGSTHRQTTSSPLTTQNVAGATSAVLKASEAGEPVTVYTSSDHLLSLIPTMYQLAELKRNATFHVSANAEAVSGGRTVVLGDHAEVMAVRQTGFAVIGSQNAQEAHDLAVASHIIARQTHTPVLHFYDGSVSDADGRLSLLGDEALQQLLSKYPATAYTEPEPVPVVEGQVDGEAGDSPPVLPEPVDVAQVIDDVFGDLERALGKRYRAFEYHGAADAQFVVVTIGGIGDVFRHAADEINRTGKSKVGVLQVRVYRPWSAMHFLGALPKTVQRIAAIDINQSPGDAWGGLFLDVMSTVYGAEFGTNPPIVVSGHVSGAAATLDMAREAFDKLAATVPETAFALRYEGEGSDSAGLSQPARGATEAGHAAAEPAGAPYIQMLNQVFKDGLAVESAVGQESIWGGAAPNTRRALEVGYGAHVALIGRRAKLVEKVNQALWDTSIKMSAELREALADWAKHREDIEASAKSAARITPLLKAEAGEQPLLKAILGDAELLTRRSRWVIGDDDWARDLADSGVHHALATGENVNVLIIDTQPYSRPSENKYERRKRDIGLYAMSYGTAYVASVAVYSSYTQVLRALMEADAYPGPSIVLAYYPTVTATEVGSTIPLERLKETKKAVDAGMWPLYRWNPKDDAEPFKLDSSRAKAELQEFLDRHNNLSQLSREAPDLAPGLTDSTRSSLANKHAALHDKAMQEYASLMKGLSGEPILILYGSDGGNAQSVAKKLAGEAKQRGLAPRVFAADDFGVDDLAVEPTVLFVVSTAGQGEFPMNCKEFWKGLQASTEALNSTRYSTFAMGDSHYWPRPDEKIYFAKSGKDLDERLEVMGAQRLTPCGIGDDQDEDGYWTGYRTWTEELWKSLGVDNVALGEAEKTITDDDIKTGSNFLRGTILEGLADESTGALAERDTKLTKFHGIYQQDDRDLREERAKQGLEKAFSFMIRVRVPGGVSTPEQYLAVDQLADKYANGTIKLTTRQAYQLHGVLKKNLKTTIQGINAALMDTLAACGDVNRNVMCTPIPFEANVHAQVDQFARDLSAHLTPATSAYHEIWLDKKMVAGNAHVDVEPLYGPTYLPRKFKIAIAIPPQNDVDVFAHCLGYIAIVEGGKLLGFNVTVGGGMGMTHSNKKTYPQVAKMLGFCTPEQGLIGGKLVEGVQTGSNKTQAIDVGEKVMLVQRDHGDRTNRKHARLKYTVDDHGIDWFRDQVEQRCGYKIEPPRAFKFANNTDRYGWTKGANGVHHYCLFVQNGRVFDSPDYQLKTGLREIAKVHKGDFRLSANQNLIIGAVTNEQRPIIEALLHKYGMSNERHSGLRLNSMACVALPTCALAMAESERYLPTLIDKLEDSLVAAGLRNDDIVMRMTGCPNGCARPAMAEIGLIGRAPGVYNLYLGASHTGERLSKLYKEAVNEEQILDALAPIFSHYAESRADGERFGDFVIRAGYVQATTDGKDFHENISVSAAA